MHIAATLGVDKSSVAHALHQARNKFPDVWVGRSWCSEFQHTESQKMKWTGVVALFAVVAFAVPAFAQAPMGAWCAGSYGAEGTNFAPCPTAQSDPQVAGSASGIQGQSVATQPQYPASQVTFEDGKAMYNKQPLNLNFKTFPDRLNEVQAGG